MTISRNMIPLQYGFEKGGESKANGPETADEFWARLTGKGKDSWGNQIAFDNHTQLANLLSGMMEPARQDVLGRIKNAGLLSLAYYTAGFESLPMLAKRLYETGSLKAPEVQEAIKQGVEDTVKAQPQEMQTGGEAEMRATNDADRSMLSNFMGGGLNALAMDRFPKLIDNPVYQGAMSMAPRSVGESLLSMTPLGYFKRLDNLYDMRRVAQRELKVGGDMTNASGEVAAARRKLKNIDNEINKFTPEQLNKYKQYKASLNAPQQTQEQFDAGLQKLRETMKEIARTQGGLGSFRKFDD